MTPYNLAASELARSLGRSPSEPGTNRLMCAIAESPLMSALNRLGAELDLANAVADRLDDDEYGTSIVAMCPKCKTRMHHHDAEPAQHGDNLPPGGIPSLPAVWNCSKCDYTERSYEGEPEFDPEPFDEMTGPM